MDDKFGKEGSDFDRNGKPTPSVRRRQKAQVAEQDGGHAQRRDKNRIQYGVDDNPPWHMTILFAFQQYLLMFGGSLSIPLIVTPAMCIGDDDVGKSEVISTVFFIAGIGTLLQTTFGTRLPIIQGGSFSFLPPIFAILNLPKWKCPDGPPDFSNLTSPDMLNETLRAWRRDVWTSRMNEIQGSMAIASIFQILVGFTGILGFILHFIGPLSIAPTICLIGLHLYIVAANYCAKHWGIAFLTIVLITLFSQYLRDVPIPFPTYKKGKGCHMAKYPIFKLLPVFLSMMIAWGICAILTLTDVFPSDPAVTGYEARTDIKLDVIKDAQWFRFPYPGQFGMPTATVAATLGMLAGVISGMIESVGDYYACANLAEAPPPPVHAINRGMLFEGLGIACAGVWGSTSGVTSFSENIGAIGITKVASRRVIQVGALIMIILGMLGKFGAVFVTIPVPIIGGMFMVVFGLITAVGVSSLQHVDLNSSRNLFVFGFSVFLGLSLPDWINKNKEVIETGYEPLNQIIVVLLSTQMFVGGVVGFLLDNTIPGTLEERGLTRWRGQLEKTEDTDRVTKSPYDFPFGMSCIRRVKWLRWLPVCPTYKQTCGCCTRCLPTRRHHQNEADHDGGHVDGGYDNPVKVTTF